MKSGWHTDFYDYYAQRRSEQGFSLIETLVGIVILGFIVIISISVYISLFNNPKNLLRSEALNLASQEIEYIKSFKPYSDTLYSNSRNNIIIKRHVEVFEDYNTTTVTVSSRNKGTEIVKLMVSIAR